MKVRDSQLTKIAALILLYFTVVLLARSQFVFFTDTAPIILNNSCLNVSSHFSWAVLKPSLLVRSNCKEGGSFYLKAHEAPAPSGIGRVSFHSRGLKNLQVAALKKVPPHSETAPVTVTKLQGTTFGISNITIALPRLIKKRTANGWLFLSFEGQGELELLALLPTKRGALLSALYQDGWLYTLFDWPPSGMIATVLTLALTTLVLRCKSVNRSLVLPFTLLASLWGMWALHPQIQSVDGWRVFFALPGFLFFFLIWEWLFFLPGMALLSRPVELNGAYSTHLLNFFNEWFPTGYVMRSGLPENLLKVEQQVVALKSLGQSGLLIITNLSLVFMIYSLSRLSKDRTLPLLVSLLLLISSFIFYPIYQLPITHESQKYLGILLIALFCFMHGMVAWLLRLPVNKPLSSSNKISRIEVLGFCALTFFCLALHSLVVLEGVWNSDEGVPGPDVGTALRHIMTGGIPWLTAGFYIIFALLTAAVFVHFRATKSPSRRWLPLACISALVIFAEMVVLIQADYGWHEFTLFRYPPFAKLAYGTFMIPHELSLSASRGLSTILIILASAFLLAIMRKLEFSSQVSLATTALYLFSFVIFYWSSFSYPLAFTAVLVNAALYLFLCWYRDNAVQKALWAGVLFVAAFLTRETNIVAALLCLGATLLFSDFSHLKRDRRWAVALALLVLVLLPALLWLKYLVGSWYSWVGRVYPVSSLWLLVDQIDRWRAMPWVLTQANGLIYPTLATLGLVVAIFFKDSRKKYALFFLMLIVAEYFFTMLFARMREYDGHSRFLVPLMLPICILIGFALEYVSKGLASIARRILQPNTAQLALCVGVVAWVISNTNYQPQSISCTPLFDLAPTIQGNGNDHGFFPSSMVAGRLAQLPEGDKSAIITHYGIVDAKVPYTLDWQDSKNEKALIDTMRNRGIRYAVTLKSDNPACHEKFWVMRLLAGSQSGLDPEIAQNPLKIATFKGMRLVDTLPFNDYEVLIFELAST